MRRVLNAKPLHSITFQVFITFLISILLIFVIQSIFLAKFFIPNYRETILRDINKEFAQMVDSYTSGSADDRNKILRDYTVKYETPILVVNDNYQILNSSFFDNMSMLTIRNASFDIYKLPVEGLNALADIDFKEKLEVKALRIGDSDYYEPYLIRSGNKLYLYRQDSGAATGGSELVTFFVQRTWYTQKDGSINCERARMIYNLMASALIHRTGIGARLDEISSEPITVKEGVTYKLISCSAKVDGVLTHFVTVRPIILSGSEESYFNAYFYRVFIFFILLIMGVTYFLSRRLNAPIVGLSGMTRKLASQDFSVRADTKAKNEIGELARDINYLADNLQSALAESRQAAEMARISEARTKRLLANLAHELKTPLGIISLYTEVIERGLYEKEPEHYFQIIEHEITGLTQIIDETIQLTKLYSGFWVYESAPIEIGVLVESALSRFSEELSREKFTLNVNLMEVTVIGDGRRIEQVLTNLLSNAIKYSGSQKIIDVDVSAEDEKAIISISNYGSVSDEDLYRIWERYYRAAEDTSAVLPSQGIGLEIVREILTMHDSDYGVKQEAEKICFYFSLKLST